jgi:hypothetical protein
VLRSDVIRKRLAGKDPLARLPESAYGPDMTRSVYRAIERLADIVCAAGHAVIADAVFARPEERCAIERAAARREVPFLGLWLHAPAVELKRRLVRRRFDASDATPSVLERQLGYVLGEVSWKHLSTAGGLEDVARGGGRLIAARIPSAVRDFKR